jgi:hypothetical protein
MMQITAFNESIIDKEKLFSLFLANSGLLTKTMNRHDFCLFLEPVFIGFTKDITIRCLMLEGGKLNISLPL